MGFTKRSNFNIKIDDSELQPSPRLDQAKSSLIHLATIPRQSPIVDERAELEDERLQTFMKSMESTYNYHSKSFKLKKFCNEKGIRIEADPM